MSVSSSDTSVRSRSHIEAICSHLFAASTVLFLIGGAVIIVCQFVQIVTAQGMAAYDFAEAAGPYVFATSSVAGLLAFVLIYFRQGESQDGE